jgi:hypothetical protein
VFGLDGWIAGIGHGHPLLLATAIALLLGLRHATDPDHLSAVTTLVAGRPGAGARRAAAIGLAWGAGHATTLIGLGLPVVFFARDLPEPAAEAAEAAVGVIIIVLAVRLLLRWRAGLVHAHPHEHGGVAHVHLHGHAPARRDAHEGRPVRSPLGAYLIGLVHGVGGSAGLGVLFLASIPDPALATVALLLFASCTAISMSLCTGMFGLALASGPVRAALPRLTPVLGAGALAFGIWYLAGALALAPAPL